MAESLKLLALPDDPALAVWAAAVNRAGYWAYVLDASWRYVFVSDELRVSYGDVGSSTAVPLGSSYFSAEAMNFRARLGGSWAAREYRRTRFLEMGGYVLSSATGGRDHLRDVVAPEVADLVEKLKPQGIPAVWVEPTTDFTFAGASAATSVLWIRIDDRHGHFAGTCLMTKPAAGMSQLAAAAATADLAHLERMRDVEHPARRPTAILMADLEASSALARRLSTAEYFAFGRRLVRAADDCIIAAGGIVGRHAGDGVVAFFLGETAGSESAAARACTAAARTLRGALAEIALRSNIADPDLSLRFGLHWGATVYIGRILTAGRSEVTALGDEVNEAARIEASATGGRILGSKALIERLNPADAHALGLDTSRATYTPLADLPTATDKARRDAPAIAVCDLTNPSF